LVNQHHGLSRRAVLQLLALAPIAGPASSSAFTGTETLQATGAVTPNTLPVGLVSRHLQWTSLEDGIDLARQIGFDAIEWNVRTGGHIDPARVEQDLPKAVELTRKAGLAVQMITTAIQDAQSPYADAILRTAHGLGIRYYRGGNYFRYDYNGNLEQQLEALKPRVASLVALNQKYGTTMAYHTHSGRSFIGGNVWDLWMVIKGFDPTVIGLNYDTGHTTARGGVGWTDAAHVAHKYIQCLAIKDFTWQRRPDGTWVEEFCPVGDGMVDFKAVFALLKSGGFKGPINIHLEHDNLLGSDLGTWKLDMPRDRFVTIVKHDLDQVRRLMKDAQLWAER
jgi:sugar phosphate isomerase/epimerase